MSLSENDRVCVLEQAVGLLGLQDAENIQNA